MSKIRVLTATALFDGHDVSVNIYRRLLQKRGAEVIHLGHNRSVSEVITVAIQEDVDALLISSYQGGHNEYFRFLVDELKRLGATDKLIFGGGGGVILPAEIEALEKYGVNRLYHAVDGQKIGIDGISDDIIKRIQEFRKKKKNKAEIKITEPYLKKNGIKNHYEIARQISFFENNTLKTKEYDSLRSLYKKQDKNKSIVIGITGTGGSGKSSLIDELIGRFMSFTENVHIGVLAVDPSKSKSGGALLGDRIRYNQIYNDRVYLRSFATRESINELSASIQDSISVLKSFGFDIIFVETSGIGQGDSSVTKISDYSMYVMTAEFGAPTQLEKIDMLDMADYIVINKFEKIGSEDALREVKVHYIRTHQLKVPHTMPLDKVELPVYATSSNQFNNHGVNKLFKDFLNLLQDKKKGNYKPNKKMIDLLPVSLEKDFGLIDNRRVNYLAEISDSVREYKRKSEEQANLANDAYAIKESIKQIEDSGAMKVLKEKFAEKWNKLEPDTVNYLSNWDELKKCYQVDEMKYKIQGKEFSIGLYNKSLSVAFDGITLYGEDPSEIPDIYGKIGESGVSICTIEDMNVLLKGFDQTDPLTSVSMTINAPAPIMVAFFFMVAYRRELEKVQKNGKKLSDKEKERLKIDTFRKLRGTVQADMLKEDQGQNTCIFSINFAMKLIGDLQEYLSKNAIKNYYSLSISGYHIAEAGANPITQLAFTLANGFTYVEYFMNRGIPVDEFAPNLSFFFSNGMDPEYSVIGRVARRIWAIAMKNKYGADEKSQKLKYHIQTSGRSLHAQEIDFNDIRTTLQGLLAFYDNCNSLHTNSYDEAVTTPTEESVRRSMAIQMILSNEFGMLKNENPNQGSFIMEELTDLVEEAVLDEFERISRRGGVLGAMETQYQRSKIQEESMYYETLKQSGDYPIIGVNKFIREESGNPYDKMLITRATDEEKNERLKQLHSFQKKNKEGLEQALNRLREVALTKGNIFEELLNTVEYASMGQITKVLYEIGGKYRRGM